ncbi:MAG TPA: alpha/beta hydrolase [Elusimicrobiota bacterium]|nr:alpha/beta hydrolase [Elusimicrobiota bacterium]
MEIRAVKFRVGHEWRVGALCRPPGSGDGAGVLMLHGFPGAVKNEDIATELCRRGMTVFMPRFGGCWGSSGLYSVPGLFKDARAALRLLSRYPRVNSKRLGVLGYSLGGWVALHLAAQSALAAAAVMAPALPRPDNPQDEIYFHKNCRTLAIPRPREVWAQYLKAGRAERPQEYLPRIAPAPLLFVQGLSDRLVPPAATARLYALAREPKALFEFSGEEHDFQKDRAAIVAKICGWMEEKLNAPARQPEPLSTLKDGSDAVPSNRTTSSSVT